jgi:alpha-methylacyl-CoA racemase
VSGGTGPLRGIRVVEVAGIGPGPFCCMVLADLGADVVRVDRVAEVAGAQPRPSGNTLDRARRSVAVDLKHPEGAAVVRRLVGSADVLVEGFRPGVAERLGIGPDECLAANPTLVYGRMTGWGQEGPLAAMAGHDIDYIAVAGALASFGRAGEAPVPPMNVVGDFGGGGMLLALGIAAALLEVARGGEGQVVDAAMVDGTALLLAPFYAARQLGFWGERGTNQLDTGAPFYDVYECADGGWVAVGSLEPQFYAALLAGLELDADALPDRGDQASWPALRRTFAGCFAARPRAHWEAVFGPGGHDACVAPVLDLAEAPAHPHLQARGTVVEVDGLLQPAAAPRFSRTPTAVGRPASYPGQHTEAVLAEAGFTGEEIAALAAAGAVAQHPGGDVDVEPGETGRR